MLVQHSAAQQSPITIPSNTPPLRPFTLPKMPSLPSLDNVQPRSWAPLKDHSLAGESHAQLNTQVQAGLTIPMFTSSDSSDGTFDFTMVGRDPQIQLPGLQQITVIPTLVIPVKFTFANNVVLDPNSPNACGATPATAMLLKSPLFVPISLTVGDDEGTTNLGVGQFVDLFQRGTFWQYTNPGGINPNYHVELLPFVLNELQITVNQLGFYQDFGLCTPQGFVDKNVWDNMLKTQILPQLDQMLTKLLKSKNHILPLTFPLFVFENVVLTDNGGCCIGGYHSATTIGGVPQTYGVANYQTNNYIPVWPDIVVLSHEIAEWMDDPFVNNATPLWGNIGQVQGCQGNLEVGDPLSGTVFSIPTPWFTYHVQDLAFKSWFFHDVPSTGVNGDYSLYGTFETFAADCVAGP